MSERTSEWPRTYVSILVCSRPQCMRFHLISSSSCCQRRVSFSCHRQKTLGCQPFPFTLQPRLNRRRRRRRYLRRSHLWFRRRRRRLRCHFRRRRRRRRLCVRRHFGHRRCFCLRRPFRVYPRCTSVYSIFHSHFTCRPSNFLHSPQPCFTFFNPF